MAAMGNDDEEDEDEDEDIGVLGAEGGGNPLNFMRFHPQFEPVSRRSVFHACFMGDLHRVMCVEGALIITVQWRGFNTMSHPVLLRYTSWSAIIFLFVFSSPGINQIVIVEVLEECVMTQGC